MVTVDQAIIAKLKTQGYNFEILVDCANALAVREGKDISMRDVLAAMQVFSDAHKGTEASPLAMNEIFKTSDVFEVAKQIIQKGEVQLTQEYREKLRQQKRKQILNMIHTNGVDPKNHNPHPMNRIENAFIRSRFRT